MEKPSFAVNQQGYSLAYLIGVYFGDGCITRRKLNKNGTENRCFVLQVIDQDFRDYFSNQAKAAFPKSVIYSHDYNRSGKGMVYSSRIGLVGKWLEDITGKRSLIPNLVYQSDETKAAFVEGLMDSEGWVTDTSHLKNGYLYLQIGFSSTGEFVPEMQKILGELGIRSGKIHTRKIKSGRVAKTLHLNSGDWLAGNLVFHCWRKQRKVEAHRLARRVLDQAKRLDRETFNDCKRELIERLRAA